MVCTSWQVAFPDRHHLLPPSRTSGTADGCRGRFFSDGHSQCSVHAPCLVGNRFTPAQCDVCSGWFSNIEVGGDLGTATPEWILLLPRWYHAQCASRKIRSFISWDPNGHGESLTISSQKDSSGGNYPDPSAATSSGSLTEDSTPSDTPAVSSQMEPQMPSSVNSRHHTLSFQREGSKTLPTATASSFASHAHNSCTQDAISSFGGRASESSATSVAPESICFLSGHEPPAPSHPPLSSKRKQSRKRSCHSRGSHWHKRRATSVRSFHRRERTSNSSHTPGGVSGLTLPSSFNGPPQQMDRPVPFPVSEGFPCLWESRSQSHAHLQDGTLSYTPSEVTSHVLSPSEGFPYTTKSNDEFKGPTFPAPSATPPSLTPVAPHMVPQPCLSIHKENTTALHWLPVPSSWSVEWFDDHWTVCSREKIDGALLLTPRPDMEVRCRVDDSGTSFLEYRRIQLPKQDLQRPLCVSVDLTMDALGSLTTCLLLQEGGQFRIFPEESGRYVCSLPEQPRFPWEKLSLSQRAMWSEACSREEKTQSRPPIPFSPIPLSLTDTRIPSDILRFLWAPRVTAADVSWPLLPPSSSTLTKDYQERQTAALAFSTTAGVAQLGAWLHKLSSDLPRLQQKEICDVLSSLGTFAEGLAQASMAFIKPTLTRAVTARLNTRRESCRRMDSQVREGLLRSSPWSSILIPEDSLQACLASCPPVINVTVMLPRSLSRKRSLSRRRSTAKYSLGQFPFQRPPASLKRGHQSSHTPPRLNTGRRHITTLPHNSSS